MTYYVATFGRYVLVEAENDTQARDLGDAALRKEYADLSERLGREVPIEIGTIRPATDSEIELDNFHERMVAEWNDRS